MLNMLTNQAEIFKQDVKNEVNAQAFGLFAVVGVFTLISIYGGLFIAIFSKNSQLDSGTKILLSVLMIAVAAVFAFNKKFQNTVFKAWMALLLILIMALCVGCIGLVLYALYQAISHG